MNEFKNSFDLTAVSEPQTPESEHEQLDVTEAAEPQDREEQSRHFSKVLHADELAMLNADLLDEQEQEIKEDIKKFTNLFSHHWDREIVRSALLVYRIKLLKLRKKSTKKGDEYTAEFCSQRVHDINSFLSLLKSLVDDELPF